MVWLGGTPHPPGVWQKTKLFPVFSCEGFPKVEIELPLTCPPDGIYVVEPKFGQGVELCQPQLVEAVNGIVMINIKDDKTCTPIKVIKNSKIVQVRECSAETSKIELSESNLRLCLKLRVQNCEKVPVTKKLLGN